MKLELEPVKKYWASVSGGKDSLFMLYLILQNPNKYPLDGVAYFDLEIDFDFIKKVVERIENICKERNILFKKIKPVESWEKLYNKHLYPTRKVRWCNSKYKMSCKTSLEKWAKDYNYNIIWYIGYCRDEVKRFYDRKNKNEIYPLVIEKIEEKYILEWAKRQEIYNDYYKVNARCGCMGCPMTSKISWAYLYYYYPEHYKYFIEKIKETEKIRSLELKRAFTPLSSNPKYNADYLDKIIKTKYIPKLKEMLSKRK